MNSLFEVEHIGLAARNPAALKDWYVSTLDADVVFDMRQTPPACLLRLGSIRIEIYAAEFSLDDTSKNRLAGWRHLALKVSSLDTARLELEKRGVKLTEPVRPAGGGGRVLFFSDPEGNLLHLAERLPGGFTR
jgi:glyoxylase I family protein